MSCPLAFWNLKNSRPSPIADFQKCLCAHPERLPPSKKSPPSFQSLVEKFVTPPSDCLMYVRINLCPLRYWFWLDDSVKRWTVKVICSIFPGRTIFFPYDLSMVHIWKIFLKSQNMWINVLPWFGLSALSLFEGIPLDTEVVVSF